MADQHTPGAPTEQLFGSLVSHLQGCDFCRETGVVHCSTGAHLLDLAGRARQHSPRPGEGDLRREAARLRAALHSVLNIADRHRQPTAKACQQIVAHVAAVLRSSGQTPPAND